ncbi:calcium-binding protein, partial [Sphingopyxis sp. 22461]|uniref:calcium-binding protein n=1 Tax=Sphingopyxis sp. 22461 TaxID=3453923 RepID=UPI003F85B434
YARGDGHDTIVDNDVWEGGLADTLALQQIAVADVSLSRVGEDIILTITESATGAGDGGSIRLVNMNPNRANGIEFVTFADGTRWDANYLRQRVVTEAATGGNDAITGFDGSEALSGGGGNDALFGRWGNDTLNGGTGNDTLNGDQSDDTYVYARGDGHDTIVENNVWDGGFADTL